MPAPPAPDLALPDAPVVAVAPAFANRARGELRAHFLAAGGRTAPGPTFEGGGLRLRFPNVSPGLVPGCEAVTINTAGGMAGGDRADLSFSLGPAAAVTITTQSAEKVYRAAGATTTVEAHLDVAAGGRLEWLPQETILFDEARLDRRLTADVAPDATLLMVESVVFGRLARGETLRTGSFRDRWRIRRDGRLVFAEEVALDGPVTALLDRPALGGGARAMATLLLLAPDAEATLDAARAALAATPCPGAASAWSGMLVVRLLSPSPAAVRAAIITLLVALRGRAAPRVWQ
jgi:urease accessory protein